MTPEELKECREAFEAWNAITPSSGHEVHPESINGKARWEAWKHLWQSPEKIEAETLDHAALACQRLVSSYRMEAEDQQIEGNTVIARYFIDKAAAAFQCMLAINHLPRKYKK
jgi:hypothetical protein